MPHCDKIVINSVLVASFMYKWANVSIFPPLTLSRSINENTT